MTGMTKTLILTHCIIDVICAIVIHTVLYCLKLSVKLALMPFVVVFFPQRTVQLLLAILWKTLPSGSGTTLIW